MDEKINNIKSRTTQAKLMGIKDPKYVDWGNYSSETCGSVGGAIGGDTFIKNDISSLELNSTKKNK